MSTDPQKPPNRYTHIIDLTTRGQQQAKVDKVARTLLEPDPPLPPATLDALPPAVRTAVDAMGWTSLMPVQEKAIPYMLAGQDLIVQSRTGSGKTGAFLLPLFDRIDTSRAATQALILTPTRELARQIFEEFQRMSPRDDDSPPLTGVTVYGGVRYPPQIKALKAGVHVVIGTPGRVQDHLERGTLRLDDLDSLILDEADEMLSMGFYPAMRRLKRYLPGKRHSFMFSATMPPKVRSLAREFLHEPGFLSLSVGQVGVDAIDHAYYPVEPMDKDRALVRLIEMENPDSAIIFANTRREVEYLHQFLQNYGYDADAISGDLSQKAREKVMGRIRKGNLRFMVATDVAARGIDISDLSHVFMYDIPQDPEYYVHRSGRTARAGKTGKALALTTFDDERSLLAIAHRYDINLEKKTLPTPEDVENRVAERMTVVMEEQMRSKTNLERERLKRFIPLVEQLAQEEPEVLAMLVDQVYHEHLHARPDLPPDDTSDDDPAPQADDEQSNKGRRRNKRRGGRR